MNDTPSPRLPARLAPLLRPEAYPHPVGNLRVIQTHISWVLLTGDIAYKLKRPVHYAFVDLRSERHRAFLCAEEVRLNARFAPELYLGVSRVTAAGGALRIDGAGETLEHAVRMRQFDAAASLDRLIETNGIAPAELLNFGHDLAGIHATLPGVADGEDWGSVARVRAELLGNLAECRALAAPPDAAALDSLAGVVTARLHALEPKIAARRPRVRECHGDLHARNVVRHGGRLVAFDCLEFDPALRWIDVADEVAFLWMDLRARGRADLAHAFLEGYLAHGGDFGLCPLLRLYACHRALVRAKVAALETQAAASGAADSGQHRYLAQARALLEPARPRLVLMSGWSGSGKTWLARQLAPGLDAVHLRSDLERKRLAGLAAHADSHSPPGDGLYAAGFTHRVYEHLARCAAAALDGGFDVIVDATFARRPEREQLRDVARRAGCEAVVIHCTAPEAVLRSRIVDRQRRGIDASEADLAVLAWQREHGDPLAPEERLRVIEADTTRATVVDDVRSALRD
jgi:aminoglycoside phosphotransferase family enzyme/predicted kinase